MTSMITRTKMNLLRMNHVDSLVKEKRSFIRLQNRLIKNVLSGIYDENLIAAAAEDEERKRKEEFDAFMEQYDFEEEKIKKEEEDEKKRKAKFDTFMSKYFPYENLDKKQEEVFAPTTASAAIADFDVEAYMAKHYPKNYDGPYPLIGDKAEEFAAATTNIDEESPLKKRKINFDEEVFPEKRNIDYIRPKNYATMFLEDNCVLVQNFKKHNSIMKVHYDKELDCFYDYKESRLYPTLQEASKAHCDSIGVKYPVNAWRKFKLLNKDGTLSSIERLDIV